MDYYNWNTKSFINLGVYWGAHSKLEVIKTYKLFCVGGETDDDKQLMLISQF